MAGLHRADPKHPPIWPVLLLSSAGVLLIALAVSILSSYLT